MTISYTEPHPQTQKAPNQLVRGLFVVTEFARSVRRAPVPDLGDLVELVLFGSAGDRSDDDIAAMADGLARLRPDRVVLVAIPGYLRGREPAWA